MSCIFVRSETFQTTLVKLTHKQRLLSKHHDFRLVQHFVSKFRAHQNIRNGSKSFCPSKSSDGAFCDLSPIFDDHRSSVKLNPLFGFTLFHSAPLREIKPSRCPRRVRNVPENFLSLSLHVPKKPRQTRTKIQRRFSYKTNLDGKPNLIISPEPLSLAIVLKLYKEINKE